MNWLWASFMLGLITGQNYESRTACLKRPSFGVTATAMCILLSSCGGVTIQIVDPWGLSGQPSNTGDDGDHGDDATLEPDHEDAPVCYFPLGPAGDAELAAMGFSPRKHPNLFRHLHHNKTALRPNLPACE